jgi:hypothetical protein
MKANEAGGIPSFAPLTQSRQIGKPHEKPEAQLTSFRHHTGRQPNSAVWHLLFESAKEVLYG